MTSNDQKFEPIQVHFRALSSLATSLNEASNELTKVVNVLDEALKKLNVGLTVWVDFVRRDVPNEPLMFDDEQVGYCKVNGKWGIALQHVWGDERQGEFGSDGPWLFNDAPREMRLKSVDKIPAVIEKLGKEAFETTKRVREKTEQVRELAGAIAQVANADEKKGTPPPAPPANRTPQRPPAPAAPTSVSENTKISLNALMARREGDK
jgi:hypothetical protein